MSTPTDYLKQPTLQQSEKLPHGTCADCKSVINIGIFFDGTDNSLTRDKPEWGHSNIARLSEAYKNDPYEGYFRHYVNGIGTRFEGISEVDPSFRGSPWGAGGAARIVYGLLQVLNSLHAFVNDTIPMFNDKQVKALCGEHMVVRPNPNEWPSTETEENVILTALEVSGGLVNDSKLRHTFLTKHAGKITMQLARAATTPNVSGVYLDVFGFSRGAAQARVFCTWLFESLLKDGKLCGVPAYVRFLGLFDTVASVGLNVTGHHAWATTKNLRIHSEVKSCVHYVALHEFRNNFPLDSLCVDGVLPPNCCEQLAVGCHSDVGGGYEPGVQGKGITLRALDPNNPIKLTATKDGGDQNKLSQLSLNLMLAAARKSREGHGTDGDPWLKFDSKEAIASKLDKEFACDPGVRTSVEHYFSTCGVAPSIPLDQAFREHATLYVAFRYTVARQENGFHQLPSYKYAQSSDPLIKFYEQGEKIFVEQLKVIDGMMGMLKNPSEEDFEEKNYHSKAGVIYKKVKGMKLPPGVGLFFDRYVHDSYAGFIGKFGLDMGFFHGLEHIIAEPRRYFCYRYMYQGDDTRYNAMLMELQQDRAMA